MMSKTSSAENLSEKENLSLLSSSIPVNMLHSAKEDAPRWGKFTPRQEAMVRRAAQDYVTLKKAGKLSAWSREVLGRKGDWQEADKQTKRVECVRRAWHLQNLVKFMDTPREVVKREMFEREL